MSTENEKKESEFYIVNTLQENRRKIASNLEELHTKYLKKFTDAGKEFVDGVQGDIRKVMDTVVDETRKVREKIVLIGKIEKKVSDSWNSVKARFDFPTKEEVDKLAATLESLHKKMDGIKEA